jgi:hypothetical protein
MDTKTVFFPGELALVDLPIEREVVERLAGKSRNLTRSVLIRKSMNSKDLKISGA